MTAAPGATARVPAASVRDVSKSFTGVRALRGVTLDLQQGEVHCLIGENGAGKSTLVKILAGSYEPDRGMVRIGGEPVRLGTPNEALHHGVRTIYQEHALVPGMSVAENIALGYEPTRGGLFRDRRRLRAFARTALERLGIEDIDPGALVETLGVARQQQLEIAKAVSRPGGRLVIMDEPTAPLTSQETAVLFRIIDRLRAEGLAILYVTHRLAEIDQIGDAVTVMRDGEVVWQGRVHERDAPALVETMVGRRIEALYPSRSCAVGDVVLRIRDVGPPPSEPADPATATTAEADASAAPRPDVAVRRGEIVALFGLVGAGRTEMIEALVGLQPNERYTAELNGERVHFRSPKAAMDAGMSVVPEDRKRTGIVPEMGVGMNIGLSALDGMGRGPWLRRKATRAIAQRYVDELGIRTPSLNQKIVFLSGGTQQKCVVARVLARDPDVIVLDEPTRGIDVGARAELYGLINGLCADGRAVLMITSDVTEALGMADRIYVVSKGGVVGELSAGASEEDVVGMALHAGSKSTNR